MNKKIERKIKQCNLLQDKITIKYRKNKNLGNSLVYLQLAKLIAKIPYLIMILKKMKKTILLMLACKD
jgi:hypothetical protein